MTLAAQRAIAQARTARDRRRLDGAAVAAALIASLTSKENER